MSEPQPKLDELLLACRSVDAGSCLVEMTTALQKHSADAQRAAIVMLFNALLLKCGGNAATVLQIAENRFRRDWKENPAVRAAADYVFRQL